MQRIALAFVAAIILWVAASSLSSPSQPPSVIRGTAKLQGQSAPSAVDQGMITDITIEEDAFPSQGDALRTGSRNAYEYVAGRVGWGATIPFRIAFQYDAFAHGYAYVRNVAPAERLVVAYGNANIGIGPPINIMAHEFGHLLIADKLGHQCNLDLGLDEGFATWGAGKYWLGAQPDFRSFVRTVYGTEYMLPLAESYNGNDIADMNRKYYQWASFIEFLLDTWDMDHLMRVYCTTQQGIGSGDYLSVYGANFAELEQRWQQWLRA